MKKLKINKAKFFFIMTISAFGFGITALSYASLSDKTVQGYSYTVNGRTYHVIANAADYKKIGVASWYSTKNNGSTTASGKKFTNSGMTAASKVLPLGTKVKVTNLGNGKSTDVTITDRGPFVKGRIIDLSYGAAGKLGYAHTGTAEVQVQAV